jgi:NAD(P)H-dependent FMN reductase
MIKLIALSGSLRLASSNTNLLRAAALLSPPGVEIFVCETLAGLPHFNPDLDGAEPTAALALREQVRQADGVLVACPEYAHGVPGAFKNALDWLVGGEGLEGKPVALLNAAPRATHAQAALAEILTTMGWRIVAEASQTIPLAGQTLDADGICSHPELSHLLRAALDAFQNALESELAAAA